MNVILQQDVKNLGAMGDVVRVRDGYGRNYLIPRGLAILADEKNVRRLQHLQRMAQEKAEKERKEAQAIAEQLAEVSLSFTRESSEDDKLFGSVTNRDIAAALSEKGHEIDRKNIELPEPIRTLGRFEVSISLNRGVKATMVVFVQRQ